MNSTSIAIGMTAAVRTIAGPLPGSIGGSRYLEVGGTGAQAAVIIMTEGLPSLGPRQWAAPCWRRGPPPLGGSSGPVLTLYPLVTRLLIRFAEMLRIAVVKGLCCRMMLRNNQIRRFAPHLETLAILLAETLVLAR